MSLEMAQNLLSRKKKIMSRSFLNSGTLIVIKEPMNRFHAWKAGTTTLFDVPARYRLHRLAESIPSHRFLGSLNVCKFGLWRKQKHNTKSPVNRTEFSRSPSAKYVQYRMKKKQTSFFLILWTVAGRDGLPPGFPLSYRWRAQLFVSACSPVASCLSWTLL